VRARYLQLHRCARQILKARPSQSAGFNVLDHDVAGMSRSVISSEQVPGDLVNATISVVCIFQVVSSDEAEEPF
jgi:hypothetical protein